MSRAARETKGAAARPRRGDDLPLLALSDLALHEATPNPPHGLVRDGLAEQAAARATAVQDALGVAVDAYVARVTGVVTSRLRGPRARRGTRYWAARKSVEPVEQIETKALDGDYIVPDKLATDIVDAVRPVVTRIAHDAATETADRVAGDSAPGGMFEVDNDLLGDLIDEALEGLLGGAGRLIDDLRDAIIDGETDGLELDDLLDTLTDTAGKSGRWLSLNARTLATAMAAQAAIEQARALGVTHMQWLSRRDERVRATHRAADGQVRQLGDEFAVGRHHLAYPGDPSGLPGTAEEVHNCRCGLLFADADDAFLQDLVDILASAEGGDVGAGALLDAAADAELFAPAPDGMGLPGIASLATTPEPVVGWRQMAGVLDAMPGQMMSVPAGTVLGLAAPSALNAATLAMRIPAGVSVAVSGGALTLMEPTTVTIIGAGGSGVQTALQA